MKKAGLLMLVFLYGLVGLQAQDYIFQLWPDGVPGAVDDPDYTERLDTDKPWRIRQVTDPTISVYLPPPSKTAHAAVVICPGGGYGRLAFDMEGFEIAQWLNSEGVAGIVLKYRLPDDRIMEDRSVGPLQDVQEAVRRVRWHAEEWNLDPKKIGVMGFSAGGHLAASASTMYDENVYAHNQLSARPDFSVLIYPVITFRDPAAHRGSRSALIGDAPDDALLHRFSPDERITPETPPAFLVHALDDGAVPPENSLLYMESLRKNKVPCELHLYESGGHGFGMGRSGSEKGWPPALIQWMKMHGWI
ncbi:alpha/beta hydrolase [bacterium]|nr:alpha/beta hydrolase [bacterium]